MNGKTIEVFVLFELKLRRKLSFLTSEEIGNEITVLLKEQAQRPQLICVLIGHGFSCLH